VQRYKADLTSDQKNTLKELLRVQTHHLMTPEIRRELFTAAAIDPVRAVKLLQQQQEAADQANMED